MDTTVLQERNQKLIKTLSWILILVSAFVLLKSIFFAHGYSAMITMQGITKKFDPPIGINFTLYFIQKAVELLLCSVVYVSAVYVLKFNNKWRQVLVYSLIASVIFLIMSPIFTYYNIQNGIEEFPKTSRLLWSYVWSMILLAFLVYVITKLSQEEVRLLFKQTT